MANFLFAVKADTSHSFRSALNGWCSRRRTQHPDPLLPYAQTSSLTAKCSKLKFEVDVGGHVERATRTVAAPSDGARVSQRHHCV